MYKMVLSFCPNQKKREQSGLCSHFQKTQTIKNTIFLLFYELQFSCDFHFLAYHHAACFQSGVPSETEV